ncbi:MAG TPA: 3-oxo-tetronate kinase [Baekduia sp.]|nr:3-oxo-tetronate kinase [Baekduia sp.]
MALGTETTAAGHGREVLPEGPLLGCIADDYTGGTDVASGLRRAGLRTLLLFGCPSEDWAVPSCDAVVVALKSRNLPAAEAVGASLAAHRWLDDQRAQYVYFKYCSTFDSTDDGNIGVVADALLDATGAPLTIICPASPEHGRTVYQGHLFVGDRLLSESSMRHHPLTPMTDSDLVRVLGRQTPHEVALVAHGVVRRGPEAVSQALAELSARGVRFAVTDAISDEDLQTLASAATSLKVLTGAAGLARNFGAAALPDAARREDPRALPAGPSLVLSGSCSETTLAQVRKARGRFPSYHLDPRATPDSERLLDEARAWLGRHLGSGDPLMIYSSAPPDERRAISADAEAIERVMGALAHDAVEQGVRRLIIAGGETSGAVVDALGIESVIVASELDRGVPWTLTTREPPVALLLKSGNFGQPDLFLRAVADTT